MQSKLIAMHYIKVFRKQFKQITLNGIKQKLSYQKTVKNVTNKAKKVVISSVAILASLAYIYHRESFLNFLTKDGFLGLPAVAAKEEDINININTNLRKEFNFIDKVVKKCADAVVYIEIKDPRRFDPETGQPLTTSNGSGFIIREDGWILTNAHVVINKPQAVIMVMMQDGSAYPAVLENADLNLDLALLKIYSDEPLPYLSFATSDDLAVGEWVIALGSPLSLSHSVTVGVISSVNRTAEDLGLRNFSMKYIQTDASITFGNSGGPLVNLDGDVVGINNLRITSGISFAIPIDYARSFLETTKFSSAFRAHKSLDTNNIGITTISITPYIIRELLQQQKIIPEDVHNGVLVWKVLNGTPAQKSGLEVGDIITHVNGVPVREASDIYILHSKKSGPVLQMDVLRSGQKKQIVINTSK